MLNKDQFADNHFIRTIIEEDLKSGNTKPSKPVSRQNPTATCTSAMPNPSA